MDLIELARIFAALIAVIGMIGLAAVAARKLGLAAPGSMLARPRRLALVETLALDQRRRAAIIRCDGREHLVILNAASVTVIERGIPHQTEADAPDPLAAFALSPMKRLSLGSPVVNLFGRQRIDGAETLRAAGAL
jgi:flagellar protein FliO/FliZ